MPHRNPMDPPRHERIGLYRPGVPVRVPRSVPDDEFNEIFARLPSHRVAGIAMAFKLIEAAQARWRAVNAPHLVVLVRAGATFKKGASSSSEPFTAAPEFAEAAQSRSFIHRS